MVIHEPIAATDLEFNLSLRSLAIRLIESGVTNFDAIAELMDINKKNQQYNNLYNYDDYTEFGSSSSGTIISKFSGDKKDCILWCINHYLGLNRHPKVLDKVCKAVMKFGTGSGTSAFSGGRNSLHIEIENKIKQMTGKESVLIFPTGYTANLGAISSIIGKNDLALFDRECHASMIDGIRMSKRKHLPFKHNDLYDLESKLKENYNQFENIFIFVESAYSMSGDLCPLKEIIELKKIYNFYLYVDEAHTFGLYGEQGRGFCYEQGIINQVDFIMSTFSKATASIGGFIATKEKYKTFIEWQGNAVMFQACFSPADAATILACLDEINNNSELIMSLHIKNDYMRSKLTSIGFNLGQSKSPIIPVYISDYNKLLLFSKDLFNAGIFSIAVVFPAVKMTEGRIRFILNASHTYEQIDSTVTVLEYLGNKYGLI